MRRRVYHTIVIRSPLRRSRESPQSSAKENKITSVAFSKYVYLCAEWQALVAPGFSPACAALKGGSTVNVFSERNAERRTRSGEIFDPAEVEYPWARFPLTWANDLRPPGRHPTSTLTRPRRPPSRRKRPLAGSHLQVYRIGADTVVSFGSRRNRHSAKWLIFHALIGICEILKL